MQVNKIEFNDEAISGFIRDRMMDNGEIIIVMCRSNKIMGKAIIWGSSFKYFAKQGGSQDRNKSR